MISAVKNMKNKNWWAVTAILIQTLFLLTINTTIITSNDLSVIKSAITYINVGLVILCIFNLLLIKSIEQKTKIDTRNLLLRNHLNQLESILKSSAIQQHEYSRHMQTLQALIGLSKFEKAQEYINGITDRYYSDNIIYYIDHPAVSALINSKNSVAQINNIDFAVAVKCNLAGISMPAWDLCSVLGNLLDNAIEAAVTDPNPRIGVEFKYENGFYVVYINNNGSLIKEPSQIFTAGYTTKGSEGRGYGLYIVNKLVQKYHGEIEIISKPKTTVILRIPGAGEMLCWRE